MKITLNNGDVVEALPVDIIDGKEVPVNEDEVPEGIKEYVRNIISQINLRPCELCGETNDCRPYGPKGEDICGPCGAKDTVSTFLAAKAHMGEEYATKLLPRLTQLNQYPTDLSKMN